MHEPEHVSEGAHPSPSVYVRIAVILAIITAIEVATYYVEAFRPVLLPVLLTLSAAKFALVAMFYMHLRFDSRIFSGFFVSGLLIAASVIIAFIALFHGLIPV